MIFLKLLRREKKTLGEEFFAESFFLRRELFFLLSAKSSPRAQGLALTKEYSLGEDSVSRSVYQLP
jgi:hypothetical protein